MSRREYPRVTPTGHLHNYAIGTANRQPRWGISPSYTCRFINEGLAVAFDLNYTGDKMARARQVFATRNFRGVGDIWDRENMLEKPVLYPVAGAFVQYLYLHGSIADFKRLIKCQTRQCAMSIYGRAGLKKLMHDFDTELGVAAE